MKKYKTPIIVILVVIVLVALFALPRFTNPMRKTIGEWKKIGVGCINEGQTALLQHIHPELSIIVDGAEEAIPTNIGNVPGCTAELHSHDETGKIHVESPRADEKFTLSQVFTVWGKSIEREGYELKATLDNEPLENAGKLILKDGQKITLEYAASAPPPESALE